MCANDTAQKCDSGILFQKGFINLYLEVKTIDSLRMQSRALVFSIIHVSLNYFSIRDVFEIYICITKRSRQYELNLLSFFSAVTRVKYN